MFFLLTKKQLDLICEATTKPNRSNSDIELCEKWEGIISIIKEVGNRPDVLNNFQISSAHPWLTREVIEGLLEWDKELFKKKVVRGMGNTDKKVGRPYKAEAIHNAIAMYRSGNFTIEQIEAKSGINKSTLYRHLRKLVK